MTSEDIGGAIAACGLVAYVLGIPMALGFMMAKGMGALAVLLCLFWPAIALVWFGFWVAA